MRGTNRKVVLSRLMTIATAGTLLALSGHAAAGIVDPGNPGLFWTEAVNDSWHTPGNWNTGFVPGQGTTPVILDATANINLNGSTNNLTSLYLGHQRGLSTNGHILQVTNGLGAVVIHGLDTNLFVASGGGGGFFFNANILQIENDGRLELGGGSARVFSQLTASSGGRISGHGVLRVNSPTPAALNMFNAGPLTVSNGNLLVEVFDGGSFAPPQNINVIQANRQLTVNAPLFFPVNNLTLGTGCTAGFVQPWSVDGQITGQAGSGNVATINNTGALTMDGTFAVNSGQLTVQPSTTLATGSSINLLGGLGNNAILRLNGTTLAQAGQSTTLGFNSRLRIDGPVPSMWLGSINSTAGILEPNTSTGFWRIDADMNLGSFGGLRTRLEGSVITRAYGDVTVSGIGAVLNSPFTLQQGSTMEVVGANTQLINNSEFSIFNAVPVNGDGRIVNNDAGIVRLGTSSDVNVAIENAGTLHAGYLPESIAAVHVGANYTQFATGRLGVNINGPTQLQHDTYEFSGTATLAGELEVVLGNGFEPQIGDVFEVVLANGGVSGAFDALTGEPGFVAVYTPTTVSIEFVGDITPPTCTGDLNGDGVVDAADLGVLLASFGISGAGDMNGDGITDASDLGILLAVFGSSCPE